MTETKPQVYQAIVNVMRKVNAVPKDSKNRDQGFAYRSIDAVMAELHDIMAEEGLFVVPTVLETLDTTRTTKSGAEWNHVKSTIAYDFYATDGSSLRAVVRGEALDSGDKASNKALSIALKYVATQTFMIPTEEAKDPDATTPVEAVKKPSVSHAATLPSDTATAAQMNAIAQIIKEMPLDERANVDVGSIRTKQQASEFIQKHSTRKSYTSYNNRLNDVVPNLDNE